MFLNDNACQSSDTLEGKCAVYAVDGGCRVCDAGFYRNATTCVGCRAACKTCANGESCSACAETHFMGIDGVCRPKGEVVGCAVDISSDVGCVECLPEYFTKDRTCSLCNGTFEHCAVCDAVACGGCVADHVLTGGICVHFTNVTHCTEAADSQCSA